MTGCIIPSRCAARCRRRWPAQRDLQRGFTLLELLVVMLIIGTTIGLVSLQLVPSQNQAIQQEAQRIALLLQLGRDEAILRNRPVAFAADAERYGFLIRESQGWRALADDDLLHMRAFRQRPMQLSIVPPQINDGAQSSALQIVFGREPVDKPFLLTLSLGDASAVIRADGVGHFSVE